MILFAARGGGWLFVFYQRRRNTLTVVSFFLDQFSSCIEGKSLNHRKQPYLWSFSFLFPNVNPVCACFVLHSWAGCGQSYGVEVCWWSLWWKHQAHSVPLPHSEDASDSTWKGHHRRVHQKWGFQVSFYPLRDYTELWCRSLRQPSKQTQHRKMQYCITFVVIIDPVQRIITEWSLLLSVTMYWNKVLFHKVTNCCVLTEATLEICCLYLYKHLYNTRIQHHVNK